jgi:long-chain acyl-CoA synthetase
MSANLAELILHHCAESPLRPALITDGGVATYGELGAAIEHRRHELPRRSRVAILPRPNLESIAGLTAVWLAGCSAVLLHKHLPPGHARDVLRVAGVAGSFDETARFRPAADQPFRPSIGELFVGLTSGSSGRPKPFTRSHHSWFATFRRSDTLLGSLAGDIVAVPGAVDHSHFLYGLVHGLANRATVDLRSISNVDWDRVAVVYTVPTISNDIALLSPNWHSLKVVLSSGASWTPEERARFVRQLPSTARCYDFYGAGELSFVAATDVRTATGVGRPFPGVEVRIRPQGSASPGPDDRGVVEVRSDMLFDGYLGRSGRVLPRDEWVSVGDIGYMDAGGHLHLAGRTSRMFTRGALNVEPEAIERALLEHPDVTAAACVPRPDSRWGSVPVAVVTTAPPVATSTLRKWCADRLDIVHRPAAILTTDRIPTTHRGKPDYAALKRLAAEGAPQ